MVAQTQDRRVKEVDGKRRALPVKANAVCHQGALAVMSGAVVQPGASAAALRAVGIFEHAANNAGGADGAIEVTVRRGTFLFANDVTAPVTAAHIGSACYVLDDQTVTSDATARSAAGTVFDVDADGVWVTI